MIQNKWQKTGFRNFKDFFCENGETDKKQIYKILSLEFSAIC